MQTPTPIPTETSSTGAVADAAAAAAAAAAQDPAPGVPSACLEPEEHGAVEGNESHDAAAPLTPAQIAAVTEIIQRGRERDRKHQNYMRMRRRERELRQQDERAEDQGQDGEQGGSVLERLYYTLATMDRHRALELVTTTLPYASFAMATTALALFLT